MDVIVERCAGLDVHRDNVVATVRVPGSGRRQWDKQTQTFKSTLAGLAAARWLAGRCRGDAGWDGGDRRVLEDGVPGARGTFRVLVAQRASHAQRPGSQDRREGFGVDLSARPHGLVSPSFVPPAEIRRLRDLTRLRAAQTNERTRTIQRLEKVLQDAGIKLSSVASTTYSKSARAMLEALLRA